MSDDAYICSCEFKELVDTVDKSAIIRIILQILRIPVNNEMILYKCGSEPCKDFVTTVVEKAKNETEIQQKATSPLSLTAPVNLNAETSITAPINTSFLKKDDAQSSTVPMTTESSEKPLNIPKETLKETPQETPKEKQNGGRIIHSRSAKAHSRHHLQE
jgi:hypothetical protein